MSLPEVRLTRERIESCTDERFRMFLKAEYLFGARAIEVAGKLCSCDILRGKLTQPYGPKGTDAWLAETDPPDIPQREIAEILITAMSDKEAALGMIRKLSQKVPVAVFKISIAKQHIKGGEEIPIRLIALPMPEEYEPWTKELYEYFKAAGDDYVFPFNRQAVWEYITRKQRIFDGLTYKIQKYMYLNIEPKPITIDELKTEKPEVYAQLMAKPANDRGMVKVNLESGEEYRLDYKGTLSVKLNRQSFSHPRKVKNHGLRHVRVDELLKKYNFDGLDLAAYVGWSMTATNKNSAVPHQTGTYAELREMWPRYIKKLCKKSDFVLSSNHTIPFHSFRTVTQKDITEPTK